MDILLVDDNPEYLLLTRDILHSSGYTVFTARDGAEGCEILSEREIDLIISDVKMPQFDGLTLHTFARETDRYKETKFVFVSGARDTVADVVAMDPKIDFFLPKTTPLKEFLQFIDTLAFGPCAPA
jgi:two-component system alkaline phosphatase synthesis response regulator PhoP